MPLIGRNETRNFFTCQGAVFRFSARNSPSPHSKTARFHIGSHYFNRLRLGNAELVFDYVERRAVFPSHPDNSVDFRFR